MKLPLAICIVVLLLGCDEKSVEERAVEQKKACLELGGKWEYPAWFPCTYPKRSHR